MSNWIDAVKNERGSQLIELLMIIPILFTAFLIIWQMTIAAYTFLIVEAAARDGARAVAVAIDLDDKETRLRIEEVIKRTANGLHVEVEIPREKDIKTREDITIIVHAKLPVLSVPLFNQLDIKITSDSTMRLEREAGVGF